MEIKIDNWKLSELMSEIKIISNNTLTYKRAMFTRFNMPEKSYVNGLDRSATTIDWKKVSEYFPLNLNDNTVENKVTEGLSASCIVNYTNIILVCSNADLVVSMPVTVFISNWLDLFISNFWEIIGVVEASEYYFELTRDYILHSNFKGNLEQLRFQG